MQGLRWSGPASCVMHGALPLPSCATRTSSLSRPTEHFYRGFYLVVAAVSGVSVA